MTKRIIYYTSEGCTPCEQITKLVSAGKFSNPSTDEVDVVDIGTDEGFARFAKEVLSKNDGAVPSAYLDGEKCEIQILDDDSIFFKCPSNDPPATPDGKSSLPELDAEHDASPPDPQASAPESSP